MCSCAFQKTTIVRRSNNWRDLWQTKCGDTLRFSTYFGTVLQHFIHQTHGERKPPISHVTQPCATTVTRSLTSSERISTLRNNQPLCRMGSLVGFPNATTVAQNQPCQFCPILTSASQRTLEHNARKKKMQCETDRPVASKVKHTAPTKNRLPTRRNTAGCKLTNGVMKVSIGGNVAGFQACPWEDQSLGKMRKAGNPSAKATWPCGTFSDQSPEEPPFPKSGTNDHEQLLLSLEDPNCLPTRKKLPRLNSQSFFDPQNHSLSHQHGEK